MTSIHPERCVGTSVCSWNILYFSVPHKSTTAVTNPHCMSLSDSLSALRQDLQSETPTPAQVQALYTSWVEAQTRLLSIQMAEIQRHGEAQIVQKAAQALADIEAKQAETLRLAREAVVTVTKEAHSEASTSHPDATAISKSDAPSKEELANPASAGSALPLADPQPEQLPLASGAKSVNARYAGLKVGLNDRVAFVKHLFHGEDDDFQRVVAALATMESKQECETFLENAVYSDYDWSQKPEIAERFLALVYARFE
jgi:hypothetical protein